VPWPARERQAADRCHRRFGRFDRLGRAALAVAVVLLDLAFILLYRSGFPVSFGALVTQVAAALALLGLGLLFFKDRLTLTNSVGVVLCLAGLWLVNRD